MPNSSANAIIRSYRELAAGTLRRPGQAATGLTQNPEYLKAMEKAGRLITEEEFENRPRVIVVE